MLKSWSLEDFKSYRGLTTFDLTPLTVFCGSNSSGKSSVIQSILLIKQTIQHSPTEHPLSLNGPLVQLGNFKDVCNSSRQTLADPTIRLSWILSPFKGWVTNPTQQSDKWDEYHVDVTFDPKENGQISNPNLVPSLNEVKLTGVAFKDGAHKTANLVLRRPTRKSIPTGQFMFARNYISSYNLKIDSFDDASKQSADEKSYTKNTYPLASAWHFLPENFLIRFNNKKLLVEGKLNSLAFIKSGNEVHEIIPESVKNILIHEIKHKYPEAFEKKDFIDTIRNTTTYAEFANSKLLETYKFLFRYIASSQDDVKMLIEKSTHGNLIVDRSSFDLGRDAIRSHLRYFRFKVKYLGPLRDEPKATYPLSSSPDATDVGVKGERTAVVLNLQQRTDVFYFSPSAFVTGDTPKDLQKNSLKQALKEWLIYLNLAQDIKTEDRGKLGHLLQVQIIEHGPYHDLTNIGVGVSQVLPILVMCLLSQPGDTLIFEQPELHLNPSVQTKLADFFIAMRMSNRQCIIETHSEYLIERLRFRIAQENDTTLLNDLSIYFLTYSEAQTKSKRVSISKYGAISDWPEDFFDQSGREKQGIIRAAMLKKNNENRD